MEKDILKQIQNFVLSFKSSVSLSYFLFTYLFIFILFFF